MKYWTIFLILLALSSNALAEKFELDKAHSSVEFSVKHLGLFPVKGRFTKFTGSVDYNVRKGVITEVYIKVDADSINTGNDDRDAHLKNKDFFHVRNDVFDLIEKNRYLEFWAKNYSLKSPRHKGKLKILKTKRPIELAIQTKTLPAKKMRIGIMAEGEINRQQFGLTWQKSSSGLKEKLAGKFVGDQVKIVVNMVFIQK